MGKGLRSLIWTRKWRLHFVIEVEIPSRPET